MSIVSENTSADFAPFPVRRFTVDEYHRLAELGVLSDQDRVELLEGWLVPKMIHNPAHDGTIEIVDELLRPLIPDSWRLRIQSSITTEDSEPEPDLAIVKGPAGRYLHKHPAADDIGLLIEVADSSVDRDREKRRMYANAGIAIYWNVNLPERQVEVYRQPSGSGLSAGYEGCSIYSSSDDVPVELTGQEIGRISVAAVFPEAE